jgi:DNA-binding winged helix-turn-helix (wHTH) protein
MDASGTAPDFGRLPLPQAPALARFHFDPELAVQSQETEKPLFARVTDPAHTAAAEVSFGPFRLLPTLFLVLEGDKPVPLGSRALEILIALVERAGELVSKQELTDRVWPNLFVGPANLTVHISALRRTLRDGQDGNRFIINIPGRGYCFVASDATSRQHKAPLSTVSRKVSELERHLQTKLSNRSSVHSSRPMQGAPGAPRGPRSRHASADERIRNPGSVP